MSEKNYSANFKLFNRDGLQAQFTVRTDEPTEHINALTEYLNAMYAMGWSINEPERGLYTTDHVIGYIWCQFNNKKTNQIDICCALYTDRGLFKSYTVYPEAFDKLPQYVMSTMPDDPERALPTAPDKEKALTMKAFKPWRTTINITPKLNHDGEPLKNDNGYVVYLYDGVAGGKTQPAPAPAPAPTKPEPQPAPAQPVKAKVTPELALVKARHTFHALGVAMYGEEWDAKRAKACQARGLASSNDADLSTMQDMIARLEGMLRQECHKQAELNGWLGETLANLCEEMQHGAYRIDDMRGVALANLLKELRLPCELSDEELAF